MTAAKLPTDGRGRALGRRVGGNGGRGCFNTLPKFVEPGHGHLLDSGVGCDDLVNLPLCGVFRAALPAHAQVSLDPSAVRFAQPSID